MMRNDDIGHSNLEFQEHVIRDIILCYNNAFANGEGGYTSIFADGYPQFIISTFDKNDGTLNLNQFTNGINDFFDDFRTRYSNTKGYNLNPIENYNYQWSVFFDKFGIKYE